MAVASDDVRVRLPTAKRDCQKVLRQLGWGGLRIDAIAEDRVFALTSRQLVDISDGRGEQFDMRRKALTIVFTYDEYEDQVRATELPGWVWDETTGNGGS